uniref:Caspase recruitment domain family, member 11 n=1 Tax=Gouania willdenowi TaxID=441366 RepID=A0A8C5DRG4_GOUWI
KHTHGSRYTYTDCINGTSDDVEILWEQVECKRYNLCRIISPSKLTPYLRQCKVLDEQDEDEILNSMLLVTRANRTSRLLDIVQTKGERGYVAFLESLEFYYPDLYKLVTGKEPTRRFSTIVVEEGHEGLTQFLMNEVMKLQQQSKVKALEQAELSRKNCTLEDNQKKLRLANQELQAFQQRYNKLKEERNSYSDELLRVKDENYKLAMRYATLSEEKNMTVMRSRDLQLENDQLKHRLNKLDEECKMERRQSLKLKNDIENRPKREQIFELERENEMLHIKLQELQSIIQPGPLPASDKAILDILEHDRQEALEDRQDLVNRLYNLHEEVRQAEELRDKYLQEKEDLELKCSTLKKDCEMYRKRMDTITGQLEEVEKERDQAFRSRDEAQHQFSQSVIDKDRYRKQIRELEEKSDELHIEIVRKEAKLVTLESRLRRLSKDVALDQSLPRDLPSTIISEEEGLKPTLLQSEWSSDESQKILPEESRLRRRPNLKAVVSLILSVTVTLKAAVCRIMRLVLKQPHSPLPSLFSNLWSLIRILVNCGALSNFFLNRDDGPPSVYSSSSSYQSDGVDTYDLEQVNNIFRKLSLERPFRPSLSSFSTSSASMKPVQELSLPGDSLLKDVTLVGGNKSGIFISSVQPGSNAEKAGLREGLHLLLLEGCIRGETQSVSMDTSTQEEALWMLQHCTGQVQLHYRANYDTYRRLQRDLVDGTLVSGDSFYIRVNLNIPKESDGCSLPVLCDEVVHVLDTRHQGRCEWLCARVDPYTGQDLAEQGTLPSNSRAQQLLLVKIQKLVCRGGKEENESNLNATELFQLNSNIFPTFCSVCDLMNSNERVRIINSCSTTLSRPGVETPRSEADTKGLDSDLNLNLTPYSLVIPQQTQSKRPVLFIPTALASTIIQKILSIGGATDFNVCKHEILYKEELNLKHNMEPVIHYKEKHATFECVAHKNIEAVAAEGKHCLLKAELSCVKDFLRREIYPIIIYVKICDKNIKKLRKLPVRVESEEEFLKLCRAKEKELEGLPCLYTTIDTDSWAGTEDLIRVIKDRIVEEQKKVVWVEQDLLLKETVAHC